MNPFIPSSPTLTEKQRQRDKLTALSKDSQAEVVRLSKLHFPNWIDATVIRVTDVDAPKAAFIGFKRKPNEASVVASGTSEETEAARKTDIIARTIAGETVGNMPSVKEQLINAQRQLAAYEAAIEHVSREIEHEKNILKHEYAKSLEPKHREQMLKLTKAMLDLHGAWSDVWDLKLHLSDSQVGLKRTLCRVMPDFLGSPADPYSDLADFFADAKNAGLIREVPESLRMKVYR